jgi:3-(3-hydroxy-phenyl)propionate hydroxylase
VSRRFRDAVLQLAQAHPFARNLVNSGRLSLPHTYTATPLSTPDRDAFNARVRPGSPALDAPLKSPSGAAWLVDQLGGSFAALYYAGSAAPDGGVTMRLQALERLPRAVRPLVVCAPGRAEQWRESGLRVLEDTQGLYAARYDATPDSLYLMRPDQHVAARWRHLELRAVREAVARATATQFEESATWAA